MIRAAFHRNAAGRLCGFDIRSHGDPAVCAAVSALAINAVNSIERFTGRQVACEYDASGRLTLDLPEIRAGAEDRDCALLMESLLLGLTAIRAEYGKEIRIAE